MALTGLAPPESTASIVTPSGDPVETRTSIVLASNPTLPNQRSPS